MDFFEEKEFEFLTKYSGELKTNDLQTVYNDLQRTYQKVEYWAMQVQKRVFPNGEIKVTKKPTNQSNIFDFYQWAKIYPTKEDFTNKIIAYTVNIDKNKKLIVRIDTVGLLDNNPLRQKYYQFRQKYPINNEYELKDFSGWDDLVSTSINDILSFAPFYDELKKLLILPATTNTYQDKSENIKDMTDLNQILYGPPGTGKTYNTINRAISIANPSFDLQQERTLVKKEYDRLVEAGQIVFTTFHQSMSYEDFIEGIKPSTKKEQVFYSVEDGIFKTLVKNALSAHLFTDEDKLTQEDDFEQLYTGFIESIKGTEGVRTGTFKTMKGNEIMLVEAGQKAIYVKYLWNNNKTKDTPAHHIFSVNKEKLKKLLQENIVPDQVKNLKVEIFPLVGHIVGELFAVYKSFYDYVITNRGEAESIHYDANDQRYFEVKEQFDLSKGFERENKSVKPYVLIIDEINRGNISQIFGELITLIEESKRLGKSEELEVTLPYSKDSFGIPSNLYIIGTMNTADRSVEALDTALRRRFSFVEMMPNLEVLKGKSVNGIVLRDLLEIVNRRVEVLLGRDHTIGHSYFVNVETEYDLRNTFKNNIIPLLQEYFYGDYDKIGLILGNGFFDATEKYDQSLFADFTVQNRPELGSFKRLKSIDDNFPIIDALNVLMKKPLLANA